MIKRPVTLWIVLSLIICLAGFIWSRFDSSSSISFPLYIIGWISSLLAIGYYSTPSNSLYGKIAYGSVIIMVVGIVFKILHLTISNELIIAGLLGIFATYVVMWYNNRKL